MRPQFYTLFNVLKKSNNYIPWNYLFQNEGNIHNMGNYDKLHIVSNIQQNLNKINKDRTGSELVMEARTRDNGSMHTLGMP